MTFDVRPEWFPKGYRLGRVIGRGGMGVVFECTRLCDDRLVALKMLNPEVTPHLGAQARFRREGQNALMLSHPNVVDVIEVSSDQEHPFIVMELIPGPSLARIIKHHGYVPLSSALPWMVGMLRGLEHVHNAGIVHRDIKPSNILLVDGAPDPNSVKICDFGIAKSLPSGSSISILTSSGTGHLCGTPEYMSPEQARGEPIDHRSDIFSLSIVFYQMLTGQLPFGGNTQFAIVNQILSGSPIPWRSLSRGQWLPVGLESLVMSGLAKRPEDRIQSSAEFAHFLNTTASLEPRDQSTESITQAELVTVATKLRWTQKPPINRRTWNLRSRLITYASIGACTSSLVFFLAPEALRVDTSDLIQDSKNAQDSYVPMHFGGGRELVLALDSALEAPKSSKRTDRHFGHAPKTQRDPPSNDTSELQVSTSIPIQPQTLKNARNLLETNRTEEACKYAEIAREKGDFDPKLLKFLGQCYMRLAMPQTAERYYRDYLVAEPDAADAPFIQAIVRARVSGKSLRNIDSPTVRAERSGQDSK